MDIGVAASIATFIDLSAKVASLCISYAKDVKNAKNEITRLQTKVEGLEKLALDIQKQLDGDEGPLLSTSQKLKQALIDSYAQVESVRNKLDPSQGKKIMRGFGLRALKWPFKSGEIDKIIAELEKCNAGISLALNIDQLRVVLDISKEINLQKIPSAVGAAFDSFDNELDARCHPETRIDLLSQIKTWARDPKGACIFWLNGMAGTGKSTISRTIAQHFKDDNLLGASFFFKRGESDREKPSKLFTTIAAQLARRIPGFIPHLRSAIEDEPEIANKSLGEQFNSLVFQPLNRLNPPFKILILVIDALDECDRDDNIRIILELLSKMQDLKAIHARIFLTSRPELPIRLGFGRMSSDIHKDVFLQDVPPTIIKHDISVFLRDEFSRIKLDFNTEHKHLPEFQLPPDWPSNYSMSTITEISVPLFIFAATICRFVGDTFDWNPSQKLDFVLRYGTTGASQLDRTYLPIFKRLEMHYSGSQLEKFSRGFKSVIGTVMFLVYPFPISSLAVLLGTTNQEIYAKLHNFHSVLSVPSDPNMPIQFLHLSFREFLLEPERASREGSWFWIDEKKIHYMIAMRCLDVLSSTLRENICGLEYPGMPPHELATSKIDESLPMHIRYACKFWVHHLENSGERIADGGVVHKFLRVHFLHWLEVLCILGSGYSKLTMIDQLRPLIDKRNGSEISGFLSHGRRFLRQSEGHSTRGYDLAPLQLYSSAILFSPDTCIIRKTYEKCIPAWIYRSPTNPRPSGIPLESFSVYGRVSALALSPDGEHFAVGCSSNINLWSRTIGCVGVLKGHGRRIRSMIFSHSGEWLISASDDETMIIWDVEKQQKVRGFQGYCGVVNAAQISADDRVLASGSNDGMVRLWNVETGQSLKTYEGHSDNINGVALSPDGKQLASASSDNTIILWDTKTGQQVKAFTDHITSVSVITFSSDGKGLVSASKDGTVRIHDIATGEQLHERAPGEYISEVTTMAMSPDGSRVALGLVGLGLDEKYLGRLGFATQLWDTTSNKVQRVRETHDRIHDIAFSTCGKQLISKSGDVKFDIDICDATSNAFEGYGSRIANISFSHDGNWLASVSENEKVSLHEVATEKVEVIEEIGNWGRMIAVSANGAQLAVTSPTHGIIKLRDAATKEVRILAPGGLTRAQGSSVADGNDKDGISKTCSLDLRHCYLKFSPDGKQLALLLGKDLWLWNIVTEEVEMFERDPYENFSWDGGFSFSLDSKMMAFGTRSPGSISTAIVLWDIATKTTKALTHTGILGEVCFSPDSKVLASSSSIRASDKTIRLWNIATGEQIGILVSDYWVKLLRFSTDGQSLETTRGVLTIPFNPSSAQPFLQNHSDHIFLREGWVMRGAQRLFWIHDHYKWPSAVSNDKVVAICHKSGSVHFFGFK